MKLTLSLNTTLMLCSLILGASYFLTNWLLVSRPVERCVEVATSKPFDRKESDRCEARARFMRGRTSLL